MLSSTNTHRKYLQATDPTSIVVRRPQTSHQLKKQRPVAIALNIDDSAKAMPGAATLPMENLATTMSYSVYLKGGLSEKN